MSAYLHIAIIVLLTTGCSGQSALSEPVEGEWRGRHYNNAYLGFSLDLPANWDTASYEQSFRDSAWLDILDKSIPNRHRLRDRSTWLFSLCQGKPSDSLFCLISCIVEDTAVYGSETNYLEYDQRLFRTDTVSFPRWEFSDSRVQQTIGGKDFRTQACFVWTDAETKHNRVTYCRVVKDRLLVLTVSSFWYKASLETARSLLRTVKWEV